MQNYQKKTIYRLQRDSGEFIEDETEILKKFTYFTINSILQEEKLIYPFWTGLRSHNYQKTLKWNWKRILLYKRWVKL